MNCKSKYNKFTVTPRTLYIVVLIKIITQDHKKLVVKITRVGEGQNVHQEITIFAYFFINSGQHRISL